MGWLWSSSAPKVPERAAAEEDAGTLPAAARQPTMPSKGGSTTTTDAEPSIGLTEAQRMRIFGRSSVEQKPQTGSDHQASDAEMEAFFKNLETEAVAAPHAQPPATHVAEASKEPVTIDRLRPDGSMDISLDVMYPRTMSCREAFDELWNCQMLGGKFNDIYRYGTFQPCSEQLSALTFCMRVRMQSEEHKQPQIRDFYAARQAARQAQWGSSEDIWEARETAVEKAFWKDPSESE